MNFEDPQKLVLEAKKSLKFLEDLSPILTAQLAKKDQAEIQKGLKAVTILCNEIMLNAQPFMLKQLEKCLLIVGDKKSTPETRELAEEACDAIVQKASPNALVELLPALFTAMDAGKRWPTRVQALKAIATFGDHAPEQLGFALPMVIPEVCLLNFNG